MMNSAAAGARCNLDSRDDCGLQRAGNRKPAAAAAARASTEATRHALNMSRDPKHGAGKSTRPLKVSLDGR